MNPVSRTIVNIPNKHCHDLQLRCKHSIYAINTFDIRLEDFHTKQKCCILIASQTSVHQYYNYLVTSPCKLIQCSIMNPLFSALCISINMDYNTYHVTHENCCKLQPSFTKSKLVGSLSGSYITELKTVYVFVKFYQCNNISVKRWPYVIYLIIKTLYTTYSFLYFILHLSDHEPFSNTHVFSIHSCLS